MIYMTNIEQGQLLLNAGYLPETADACWLRLPIFGGEYRLVYGPVTSWNVFTERAEDRVPAWSLGALWEMCDGVELSFSTREDRAEDIVNTLVKKLVETSDYKQL